MGGVHIIFVPKGLLWSISNLINIMVSICNILFFNESRKFLCISKIKNISNILYNKLILLFTVLFILIFSSCNDDPVTVKFNGNSLSSGVYFYKIDVMTLNTVIII